MSATDEEWVKAAMADEAVAAELLVRIRAEAVDALLRKPPAAPLRWSVRQRRSKRVSTGGDPRKKAQQGSPTTPLSWSFSASLSDGSGGAGDEESSRTTSLKSSPPAARSKVNVECEKTASKRMRKKTLVELKDEQNSLIKERRDLKRELSALRLNLDRQRTTNEKLKRLKIELGPNPDPGFVLPDLNMPLEEVVCGVS